MRGSTFGTRIAVASDMAIEDWLLVEATDVDFGTGRVGSRLRLGLIGLDPSHSVASAEILYGQAALPHGARLTYAFSGRAQVQDWALSWSRLDGFTAKVKEFGVDVLANPQTVAEKGELVFSTKVDGRMPRDLFEKVALRGKPVFIDKRFATSSQNAARMLALVGPAGIPLMSCSSRPCSEAFAMGLADDSKDAAVGVDVFGPMAVETAAPGLFWYGIHGMDVVLRAAAQCRRPTARTARSAR